MVAVVAKRNRAIESKLSQFFFKFRVHVYLPLIGLCLLFEEPFAEGVGSEKANQLWRR